MVLNYQTILHCNMRDSSVQLSIKAMLLKIQFAVAHTPKLLSILDNHSNGVILFYFFIIYQHELDETFF